MAERIEAGARVYATALYEAAVDAGKADQIDGDLAAIAELFDGSDQLRRTMLDPQLPHEAKKRVIAQLMADADPLARNALMVLVDNGRLGFLHDIQVAFHEISSVDPSIIGGLVLRARGVLLDASVKRELDDLRHALTTTPLPTGSEA